MIAIGLGRHSTTRPSPQKRAGENLYTVPTGQPLLLSGSHWPSAMAPQLRHHSALIEGRGETRLVLVLEGVDLGDIYPEYDTLLTEKTENDLGDTAYVLTLDEVEPYQLR
ncbi:MAG: DUF1826 domain-containing protein [Pseudomonadota bacterium]